MLFLPSLRLSRRRFVTIITIVIIIAALARTMVVVMNFFHETSALSRIIFVDNLTIERSTIWISFQVTFEERFKDKVVEFRYTRRIMNCCSAVDNKRRPFTEKLEIQPTMMNF